MIHIKVTQNNTYLPSVRGLDELNSKYDNILIIGDLNNEMSEPSLNEFCHIFDLKSIVNKPTRLKNPKNPPCIDLMLTDKQERFLKVKTVETELSDFHKMVVSVFKTSFKKQKPKKVTLIMTIIVLIIENSEKVS